MSLCNPRHHHQPRDSVALLAVPFSPLQIAPLKIVSVEAPNLALSEFCNPNLQYFVHLKLFVCTSPGVVGFGMKISKTEVNLKRLLAAAHQQQKQAKLSHYVATLREQVEQLAEERKPEGLPRFSKAVLSDYSEKIVAIASKLAGTPLLNMQEPQESLARISVKANFSETGDNAPSPGLRRRFVPNSNIQDGAHETVRVDSSSPVKLDDAAAQAHIEKHRKLPEDLTDEMVRLARQLKESSLMMSHSLQNTEKILDSTEKAVESSLARTGHATVRASDIYSKTSKCFIWLLIFVMTCIFIMVVLLIRIT